jgi:pseudoazurin
MMRRFPAVAAAAVIVAGLLAVGDTAAAREYEVKMLNKGQAGPMVFEPSLLEIQPGDSVRFVPTDKGHNVVSIDGMTPEGIAPFASEMNAELVVTFERPGVYGYKCKPHYGMGMVGMVVVGEPGDLDQAMTTKHPGKAKKRFEEMSRQMNH